MNSLNPLVSTAGVQRVYATKLNRGATPKVLIQVALPVFPPEVEKHKSRGDLL